MKELSPSRENIANFVFLRCARHVWSGIASHSDDATIDGEAVLVNLAFFNGGDQGATGFAVVPAIAEATLAEVVAEFAEGKFDFLAVEMAEAEFLQSGRVDQVAARIQMVKRGMGRGVLA